MALPDIKDAGILAGFVRWGWPWHGLCEGGAIGSSGKTISQPLWGNAWLIDKGLPALDISPADIASEATEGREWRNYALIPGGQIYGTLLPQRLYLAYYEASAYVHVDEAGVNWLIELTSASYPTSTTTRLNFSIVRFGHFEIGVGEQTPITKTIDVTCEAIDPYVLFGTPGSSMQRETSLHDVWTNGSKAIFCVWFKTDATHDYREVFSAIEVSFTGIGGTDGNTLVLAATEVKGASSLSTTGPNTNGVNGSVPSGIYIPDSAWESVTGPGGETCIEWAASPGTIEAVWNGNSGFSNGYPLVTGYQYDRTSCRFCLYNNAGDIVAYRMRWRKTIDHTVTNVIDGGFVGGPSCFGGGYGSDMTREITVSVEGAYTEGYYLLQNDAIVDKVEITTHYAGVQLQSATYTNGGGPILDITYPSPYAGTGTTWAGALVSGLSGSVGFPGMAGYNATGWMDAWMDGGEVGDLSSALSDGTTVIGVRRTMNIAAFYALDTTRTYGPIATPLGNKSTTETGTLYFSWQRKTGDFAFSPNPICYV